MDYVFLQNRLYVPSLFLRKQLNGLLFSIHFYYLHSIVFLIFVKSFVQTRIKNYQDVNRSFNVVIDYFYDKLLKNPLIHRTRNVYLESLSFGGVSEKAALVRNIIVKIKKKKIYNDYSSLYFFDLFKYKKYLNYLNFLEVFDYDQLLSTRPLIDSPLMKKKTRMNFFFNKSPLYGYKFHFSGRFTRKQKAANLWFQVGYLENSSVISNVDYAFKFVVLRFSVCSIKVWLYKSNKYSSYKINVLL